MVAEAAQAAPRKHKRINVALAATLLSADPTLTHDDVAPMAGAKNGETLRQALSQRGITKRKIKALQSNTPVNGNGMACLVRQASDVLRERSERTRATLADVVERQAQALADAAVPRDRQLANLHADTVGKAVKAAAGVFGWDEEKSTALVLSGALTSLSESEKPVLDVETVGG